MTKRTSPTYPRKVNPCFVAQMTYLMHLTGPKHLEMQNKFSWLFVKVPVAHITDRHFSKIISWVINGDQRKSYLIFEPHVHVTIARNHPLFLARVEFFPWFCLGGSYTNYTYTKCNVPSKNAQIYRQKTWTFAKASGNIRRETSSFDFLSRVTSWLYTPHVTTQGRLSNLLDKKKWIFDFHEMKGNRCLNLRGNMNDVPQCNKPYNIRSSSCSTRVLVQVCIKFCVMHRGGLMHTNACYWLKFQTGLLRQ